MILTVGCSFTYGEELTDRAQAWPNLMAQQLTTTVHNLGQSGNSNDAMIRQLMQAVSTGTYSLVVVAWTSPARFETWNDLRNQPDTIMPASQANLPWTADYYRYSYNQHYSELRWFQQVVLLQAWLKSRQQLYVFVNVAGIHELPQDLEYLIDQIDCTNYVGWPGRGLIEIAGDAPVGPGLHPLELGHARIADEIAKHIRA